ncbi:MAG: oligoribonuclease [Chlamydiales bacterium]|jgi:oligoribonuclease
MARPDLIVWMDLEMTGLNPERERIIEAAVLLTDWDLADVATGPELVVHQSDELLAGMDEWNTEHHGASGLTEQVRRSTISESDAQEQILAFLAEHTDPNTAPLAGNSIWQDRRFVARYWPRIDGHLHYRIVDVSSVKELIRHWQPAVHSAAPVKKGAHRAMDDIRESIAELAHYRARSFGV